MARRLRCRERFTPSTTMRKSRALHIDLWRRPLVHHVVHLDAHRRETTGIDRRPELHDRYGLTRIEHHAHAAGVEVHHRLLDAIDALDRAPDIEASARSRHAFDQDHRVRNSRQGNRIRLRTCAAGCTPGRKNGQGQNQDARMPQYPHLILLRVSPHPPGASPTPPNRCKPCASSRLATAPGRTRTSNHQIRSLPLYPIELRAHHRLRAATPIVTPRHPVRQAPRRG